MDVTTSFRPNRLDEVIEQAQRAEALGFASVTFPTIVADPFLACALAAKYTSRIGLGTSIALAFPLSPTYVAGLAWNLQDISKGRFTLGLGTQVKGHIERRFGMPWSAPGPRMRDYVGAVKAVLDCWRSGTPKVNFLANDYSISLMTPEFMQPVNEFTSKAIPIVLGGVNPYMVRLAGELAQGLILQSLTSTHHLTKNLLPDLSEGAAIAEKGLSDLQIIGNGFVASGGTSEEVSTAREWSRTRIAFYGSTRTYRRALEAHGWGGLNDKLHEMSKLGQWKDMPKQISDEVLDAFTTSGVYEEIAERLMERFGGLVTCLNFPVPENPRHDARIRKIVERLRG